MNEREVWDPDPTGYVSMKDVPCGVCRRIENRNVDEETSCEQAAHVAALLEIYPNWEGYDGTY